MSLKLGTRLLQSYGNYFKSATLVSPIGSPSYLQIRWSTSFFMRLSAQRIWKGVTGVSSAGRKKGRGKGAGATRAKNLNRGQVIGAGPVNFVWPGLNAPVIKGRESVQIQELPSDPDYKKNLIELRNRQDTFQRRQTHALERGWSGGSSLGKWFSCEEYFDDEILKSFYGTQIQSKFAMEYLKGKIKQPKIEIATIIGNRNGCVGYGIGTAENNPTAALNSIKDAAKNLLYVPIHDNHTILHDFTSRFDTNCVYAFKMPKGYGLVCHRSIRAICLAAGIKDIYVRVEGAKTNFKKMAKAFLSGLLAQKDFQQMADEKRLHLVEFKEENGWFPNVVASPQYEPVRRPDEIPIDEPTSFHMYLNNGYVIQQIPKKYPDFIRTLGYGKYLLADHFRRNRLKVRCELRAKYGAVESFLTIREKEERAKKKLELLAASTSEMNQENSEDTSPPS